MRVFLKSFVAIFTLSLVVSCSRDKSSSNLILANNDLAISGGTVSELTLPNGIRAMVISLPGAKQPNLSVSVGVGSAHEPANAPGLAHFVEHMLFLGNKDYPNSLENNQLIESNDGYNNAYTQDYHTNYQLTTNTATFPEAIKRYSRFFVNPLFTASLVDKEKNAIQNEYVLRFDNVKLFRASSVVLNGPDTVDTFFNFGSLESLKNVTAQDAVDFYNKYYSSKNMTIVLTGPQDLATLKSLIRDNFTDVPVREVTLPEVPKDAPLKNKIVKMNSPEAKQRLHVAFQLNETTDQKVKDAQSVIGNIIADETEGSLQSVLQNEGFAPQREGVVFASISDDQLEVSVSLTNEGAQNYQRIISYIKGYVDFLKTQPEPRYTLEETNGLSKITDLNTDYTDISVSKISSINDDYNSGSSVQTLFASDRPLSYEPSDYQTALSLLNIKSMQAVLTTNDNSASDLYTEKFSKTKFKTAHKIQIEKIDGKEYIVDGYYKFASLLEDISETSFKAQNSVQFKVPQKNPYIPTHFELKSADTLSSAHSVSTQNIDVFYNPNSDITLPKTTTSIYFFSPNINFSNKKDLIHLVLMKNWLLSGMITKLYPFTLAGVDQAINVMVEQNALRINITSWNDNSDIILKDYLKLISLNKNEVAFQKFKQVTMISLQQQVQSAESQLDNIQRSTYVEWPLLHEYQDIVAQTSLKDIESLYNRFFSKFYTQAVVSGHYSTKESAAIVETLLSHLPSAPITKEELASYKKMTSQKTVTELLQVTIDEADSDTAFAVDFYHLGTTSKKEMLMSKLIGEWIGPDFYYELRTQQQLAYSLSAGHSTHGKYFGLYMYLESSSATSDHIEQAMRDFLVNWVNSVLPTKEQKDINAFLEKEKSVEEHRQKELEQDAANQKFLDLEWVLVGERENITFTMEEIIALAQDKLINKPTGLLIKIKSNVEKEAGTLPDTQKTGINPPH